MSALAAPDRPLDPAAPADRVLLVIVDAAGDPQTITAAAGMTLIASLRLAGLPVRSVCGGKKACGTCRVRVGSDWFARLPPADHVETNLLNCLRNRGETDRLACQIPINPSLEGLVVHLGR